MKPFYEQQKPVRINHQSQLDFPLHLHNAVEIIYVLKGSSVACCEAQRFALGPGDLFVAFPNQIHGYEKTEDFDGYVLVVTSENLSVFKSILEEYQPTTPHLHPTDEDAQNFAALFRLMHSDRNTSSPALLQGYGQVLFSKLLPLITLVRKVSTGDALQAVLYYIGSHYTEPITRKEIARAIGYSESHVSHMISQSLGTTLSGYITMLRMDEARRLLRETTLSVGQIAMSLGFSSVRSFNRFFMLQMYQTPTAYRKQIRKDPT